MMTSKFAKGQSLQRDTNEDKKERQSLNEQEIQDILCEVSEEKGCRFT